MNKETRQFIWGMFLLIFFSIVLGLTYINYKNGMIFTVWDYIGMPIYLFNIIVGIRYINKSIK